MFEQCPEVGLAPLRTSIYEDYEGKCHLTDDRSSTLLGKFEDVRIDAIGKILDDKIASLAVFLAQ